MACLLDFALRKLVGFKGICPGMRTVRGKRSPSLIEIAPAVWDLQYLQMMCVHAQVIPAIASGVARLRNAQSASLRAKLDILTDRGISHERIERTGGSEAGDVKDVKGRLWSLCQTRIRPEPMKGHQIKRIVDQSTTRQPPSDVAVGGQKLDTPVYYADEPPGGVFDTAGDYELVADYGHHSALPETFVELDHSEIGHLADSQPYGFEDGEDTPLDELMLSSEGDYFYTDGQGNVYSVERHEVPEDHQIEWQSSPPVASSEGFSDEEDIQVEDWDGSPNEAYIMYHEVQHWPPEPGVHIHAVDAGHFLLPPPLHPDDDPFNGWVGD
ncbi:hypothetical protein C8A05DRAFT_47215 [Staphylotrichum tortipilum]|uniref:Uncharacterized protein n=1 Tax=Staphylotrichum tortipilum TaxID=2831512 RepID=A0AAN6RQJ1_9PEZI|nr:hypothetical protein C8A05DRAFT_47215 [Staphylotrichum longicolle]